MSTLVKGVSARYQKFSRVSKRKDILAQILAIGKERGFYPTHSLGPVMQWFQGDTIKSIACHGTGWHTAPEFRQEDTTLTLCQMESGNSSR